MSSDRREPTMSPMRPESDEIRQTSGGRSRAPKGRTNNRSGGGSSGLAVFALLIAFVACGGAGYVYWLFQESQKTINVYENRIASLEGQLEMTGDESQASMAAVQAKLKWADSEIRKLWGVANDRNKKQLVANTEALEKLKKTLNSEQASLKKSVKNVSDKIAAQTKLVESLRDTSLRDSTQLKMMVDQLDQFEGIQADMTKTIRANEQAIKSIDAFRRDVNRDILQLKQGGGGVTN